MRDVVHWKFNQESFQPRSPRSHHLITMDCAPIAQFDRNPERSKSHELRPTLLTQDAFHPNQNQLNCMSFKAFRYTPGWRSTFDMEIRNVMFSDGGGISEDWLGTSYWCEIQIKNPCTLHNLDYLIDIQWKVAIKDANWTERNQLRASATSLHPNRAQLQVNPEVTPS